MTFRTSLTVYADREVIMALLAYFLCITFSSVSSWLWKMSQCHYRRWSSFWLLSLRKRRLLLVRLFIFVNGDDSGDKCLDSSPLIFILGDLFGNRSAWHTLKLLLWRDIFAFNGTPRTWSSLIPIYSACWFSSFICKTAEYQSKLIKLSLREKFIFIKINK